MLRLKARRAWSMQTQQGADSIMFGLTLPSDTVVHGINIKSTFLGANEASVAPSVFGVAFEGWVLPLLDPDAGLAYDVLWDNLVPKDSDVDTLDLDTQATDTTNFWEPGEIDMSAVFDVGLRPRRLVHQHSFITLANGALIVWQDNQTPFLLKYWPGGAFNWSSRAGFRVNQPSAVVFAVSSPNMDDVQEIPTVLSEAQIPQVKYMGDVLERALMDQLGLTESGAESPWEEASVVLKEHLDPNVYEPASFGVMQSIAWNSHGEAMIDHSVTGRLKLGTVTTGR